MSFETASPSVERTPRLARWATAGAVALLLATAGLLWWTQGAKVFLDTLSAGLAWCL
ncbi:hypothetical protein [Phreatobacter sp. AB_2022a]|uniref:hypothetical protein n=1 Tax=Phreatobacter sp. AB_2022a TaxID=3003134 RepID=UPI000579ADE0|nr:hypothetical protein [Phreatobacter sp. AB_2022a]MCZ0737542.1 hypothetical protein [Phreatobacter sp. AB_2022a]CEJ11333.1 hypothetical protein BN1110_01621 [bacterium YEK0313]